MFQFPAFASYTLFYSGEDTLLRYLETSFAEPYHPDGPGVCFVFTLSRSAIAALQTVRQTVGVAYRPVWSPHTHLC